MSCQDINRLLNRYEPLQTSSSFINKQVLTRTAAAPLFATVTAKLACEIIKLPYALATAPIQLILRCFRVVQTRCLKQALFSPCDCLQVAKTILKLTVGLFYSLLAVVSLRAAMGGFEDLGYFHSQRQRNLVVQFANQASELGQLKALPSTVDVQAKLVELQAATLKLKQQQEKTNDEKRLLEDFCSNASAVNRPALAKINKTKSDLETKVADLEAQIKDIQAQATAAIGAATQQCEALEQKNKDVQGRVDQLEGCLREISTQLAEANEAKNRAITELQQLQLDYATLLGTMQNGDLA